LSQWKRAYYMDKFGIDVLDNDINFTQNLVKAWLTSRVCLASPHVGVCDWTAVGAQVLLLRRRIMELVYPSLLLLFSPEVLTGSTRPTTPPWRLTSRPSPRSCPSSSSDSPSAPLSRLSIWLGQDIHCPLLLVLHSSFHQCSCCPVAFGAPCCKSSAAPRALPGSESVCRANT
jgi:hypothetical protein